MKLCSKIKYKSDTWCKSSDQRGALVISGMKSTKLLLTL